MQLVWLPFLCLFLFTGTVHGLDCPPGWSSYGALCIKYLGFQQIYSARILCIQFGGRLFEPRNEAMSNYLYWLLPSQSTAWLGILNNRYLSNGEIVDYSKASYTYGYAYMDQRNNEWASSSSYSTSIRTFCELPKTNTKCPFIGTLFLENTFPAASEKDCQISCRNSDGCKFWTYELNQCGLRFYEAGNLVGAGKQTGSMRTGFPINEVSGNGRSLVGRAVKNVTTAADCQELCKNDPKCNTFTWTNQDFQYGGINSKLCILNYGKTAIKEVLSSTQANQIVSGPKICIDDIVNYKDNYYYNSIGSLISSSTLKKYQEELENMIRIAEGRVVGPTSSPWNSWSTPFNPFVTNGYPSTYRTYTYSDTTRYRTTPYPGTTTYRTTPYPYTTKYPYTTTYSTSKYPQTKGTS